MPAPIGSFTPTELRERVDALAQENRATRRSAVAPLVERASALVKTIEGEKQRDERALAEVEDTYVSSHGLGSRIWGRVFGNEANEYRKAHLVPHQEEVEADAEIYESAVNLLARVRDRNRPVDSSSAYKSGMAVVFNESTGRAEWDSAYKSGIAGVYNPSSGRVEWDSAYKSGIAGVYNPRTQQVEFNSAYKSGIAGVFNPKTGEVEWRSCYKGGVAGVWNPKTEKVEWCEAYKSGVAGAYNPRTGTVVFHTAYNSGAAAVYNPKTGKVHTNDSYRSGIVGYFDEAAGAVKWLDSYRSNVAAIFRQGDSYATASSNLPPWIYAEDDD
jgi:hypothetical protein